MKTLFDSLPKNGRLFFIFNDHGRRVAGINFLHYNIIHYGVGPSWNTEDIRGWEGVKDYIWKTAHEPIKINI